MQSRRKLLSEWMQLHYTQLAQEVAVRMAGMYQSTVCLLPCYTRAALFAAAAAGRTTLLPQYFAEVLLLKHVLLNICCSACCCCSM
jgi:hypothetical protein